MGRFKGWTIRKVIPEVEIYFSSSNSFFDHGACKDFFLTNAFAFPQPPTFFSNGDIP